MRMLIISLATLFVAVIVALLAMEDPGYVLIAVGEWTIETTVALTVVILLLSFCIIYYSIRAVLRMLAVPGSLRHWQKQRHEHKAVKSLASGLIDLAEGQWQTAEKRLMKYVEDSDASLLNYLAAARAAQEQGADQRRDHYLKLALENHPSADIAVGLTQAELQLNQHQLEQALATLRHLHQLSPKHPQVLKALAGLYQSLGDWNHLLEIVPLLRKRKAMKAEKITDLSQQAYLRLLQAASLFAELSAIWTRIPESFRENEVLLSVYVRQLLKMGESDLAEPLLRRSLRRKFNESLLMLYGKIDSAEPSRQLELVESLLEDHGRDAIALLTAGRLCLRNKLWGKARSYLEASVNAQPNIEAYNELGNLLERMGESAAAAECFREGLSLVPGCEQTTPISMNLSANPIVALTNQTSESNHPIHESEMAARSNILATDSADFEKE